MKQSLIIKFLDKIKILILKKMEKNKKDDKSRTYLIK